MRNLHVPLPEALYLRLRQEAERRRRPATQVARDAIASWLVAARRAAVHREISEYAAEVAGSREDFDSRLETAAIEHLLRLEDERR